MDSYFIELAKNDIRKSFVNLPDVDLAYFPEHTDHFNDHFEAVVGARLSPAQSNLMMEQIIEAVRNSGKLPPFTTEKKIQLPSQLRARESHFGENVLVSAKALCVAREGYVRIIPGSMGDRSYIVRGKRESGEFPQL